MEARLKNFLTIRGSYTQQGLSNHITFRPIKSGATVPLKLCRTQRQAERRAAWPGTARDVMARHGTALQQAPPPPYILACVTRGAYFYDLYHFAFLECALPGVNQRPQFGQCGIEPRTDETLVLTVKRSNHLAGFRPHVHLPVTVPLTPDSSLTRNLSGNRRYS
jgi:hypothetical protein